MDDAGTTQPWDEKSHYWVMPVLWLLADRARQSAQYTLPWAHKLFPSIKVLAHGGGAPSDALLRGFADGVVAQKQQASLLSERMQRRWNDHMVIASEPPPTSDAKTCSAANALDSASLAERAAATLIAQLAAGATAWTDSAVLAKLNDGGASCAAAITVDMVELKNRNQRGMLFSARVAILVFVLCPIFWVSALPRPPILHSGGILNHRRMVVSAPPLRSQEGAAE